MIDADVTLYAQWQKLEPGSSQERALVAPRLTRAVQSVSGPLLANWDEKDRAFDPWWASRFYRFTLPAGGVYTFAMPIRDVAAGCDFTFYDENGTYLGRRPDVELEWKYDRSYEYARVDLRDASETLTVTVELYGDIEEYGPAVGPGRQVQLFFVEGDYLP